MVGTGFTIIKSQPDSYGPPIAVTAVSTAAPPVVTNTGKNNLVAGSVVQFFDITDAPQIGNIPFTVGNNTLSDTTFSIDYLDKLATAGKTGIARTVLRGKNYNPRLFYITKIEKGNTTKVTFSETHDFEVGDVIKFMVDLDFGMYQIHSLIVIIIEVDKDPKTGNTVTVRLDTLGFNDFVFPTAANYRADDPPHVIPIARCKGTSIDCCAKSGFGYINKDTYGISLKAGKNSPAGVKGDRIYWDISGTDLECWGDCT